MTRIGSPIVGRLHLGGYGAGAPRDVDQEVITGIMVTPGTHHGSALPCAADDRGRSLANTNYDAGLVSTERPSSFVGVQLALSTAATTSSLHHLHPLPLPMGPRIRPRVPLGLMLASWSGSHLTWWDRNPQLSARTIIDICLVHRSEYCRRLSRRRSDVKMASALDGTNQSAMLVLPSLRLLRGHQPWRRALLVRICPNEDQLGDSDRPTAEK